MKIFVISDIHGSAAALEKAEKQLLKQKFDGILVLGDVLYHGPRNPLPEGYEPLKVVSILNRYADKITGVRGNCDAEIDRQLCAFDINEDYQTMKLGDRDVFITHGHIYSPEMHKPLAKGSIFLYGHFHVPVAREENGIYYLNPGSCSMPKENNPCSYGVLSEDGFVVYDLDGKELKSIRFLD